MSSLEKEVTKSIKEAGERAIAKSLSKKLPRQSGLRQEIIKDLLRFLGK